MGIDSEGKRRAGEIQRGRERERDLILYLGRPFPIPAVRGDSDV